MISLRRFLAALLLPLVLAVWSTEVRAHSINNLTVTADATADGKSLALEVSAEAKKVLEISEALSLFPALLRGGADGEEAKKETFGRAGDFFLGEVELRLDTTVLKPAWQWSTLDVEEKDAAGPGAGAATPGKKHLFVVGRAKVPVAEDVKAFTIRACGQTACVLTTLIAGQPTDKRGGTRPYFIGETSKEFLLPKASTAGAATTPEPEADGFGMVFVRYLHQGFIHIVPEGLDHILFVLGLFFLARRFKPLLWQVTTFTVAHSITLALAMLDIVRLPSQPVEVAIALSIAFVAIENLCRSDLSVWRPAVVFIFGLIHGLGFAGAFKEVGVPKDQFVAALVSFNIGVEGGQLVVIATAFLLVGWFWKKDWYRAWISIPASVVIAGFGVFWAWQRMFGEG